MPQAKQILAGIKQAREAGYTDEEIYNFLAQKFRGFLQIRELKDRGYRIAKNDGQTLTGLERALSNDAITVRSDAAEVVSQDAAQVVAPDAAELVAPDDLGRIAISDTGTYCGPQWLRSIWGAIRNDLSRPVERVQLRALIYDATGRISATKEIALRYPRFDPRVPVFFHEPVVFDNLPFGYQCSVQVIEAHYVQQ